ncbi:MAG: hypothetical protein WC548_00195 [Candidatus Pacearchaeota archaeon]
MENKLTKTVLALVLFLVLGAMTVSAQENTVPVYRFWSPLTSSHFYTADENEKNHILETYANNVWTPEGIAFYVYSEQQENTVPVYRFWSPLTSSHFYTADENEKNHILETYANNVWTPEGIAFYVYSEQQNETADFTISNLKVADKSKSWILWEWENPSENFSGIAVYINEINKVNLSSEENSYKAENLKENKIYTIKLFIINSDGSLGNSIFDSEKTSKSTSDSKRTVVREIEDETPVIFTSNKATSSSINLGNDSDSAIKEAQTSNFFENLSWIHYVLIIFVILILISIVLIFKNI